MPNQQPPRKPPSRSSMPQMDVGEDEYRRRQQMRDQRRKKRRTQRLVVLAALALGVIILILVLVLIIRAILPGKDSSSAPPGTSSSASALLPPVSSRPTAADTTLWSLLLVNSQHPIDDSYEPEDLVQIPGTYHYFDGRAVEALNQMIAACNAVPGHDLQPYSAYRGAESQNKRHEELVAAYKKEGLSDEAALAKANLYEPAAAHSEHRTGFAVDFFTGSYQHISDGFDQQPEFAWLVEHCAEYGFILRYPAGKEAITGMAYQPYHFRYVGTVEATQISQANICLEEYLALPDTTPPATSAPQEDSSEQ